MSDLSYVKCEELKKAGFPLEIVDSPKEWCVNCGIDMSSFTNHGMMCWPPQPNGKTCLSGHHVLEARCRCTKNQIIHEYFPAPNKRIISPTLEELIDACGGDFMSLESNMTALHNPTTKELWPWKATGWKHEMYKGKDIVVGNHAVWGKTSKEAMANLYIKLHGSRS